MNLRWPRSDNAGVAIPNFNAQGLSSTPVWQTTAHTDTRDYKTITWEITISDKDTATKLYFMPYWSTKTSSPTLPSGSGPGDFFRQATEVIAAGAAAESAYLPEFDLSGLTAPFTIQLTLPVIAPAAAIAVYVDAGTPTCTSLKVWRGN